MPFGPAMLQGAASPPAYPTTRPARPAGPTRVDRNVTGRHRPLPTLPRCVALTVDRLFPWPGLTTRDLGLRGAGGAGGAHRLGLRAGRRGGG